MKLHRIASVVVTGLLGLPLSVVADPAVYYQENFRNYRDTPPLAAQAVGVTLDNDPIWSQRAAANFLMTDRGGLVFDTFLPADPAAAPRASSYDVLFDFRFQTDNERKFRLHLRHDHDGKPADVLVTFSATGVAVESKGVSPAVSARGELEGEIANHQWRKAVVTVRDGNLKVYVRDDQRVLKQVAEARMPALPLTGINFEGFQGSRFSVTDIVIREPGALPSTSVERLLPTPPVGDAGYKSGGQQSTVTVPANDIFGATFRTGLDPAGVTLAVNMADGSSRDITFRVAGTKTKDGQELDDAIIEVKGLEQPARGVERWHIRPLLRRYHTSYSFTDEYHDIVRDWEKLPAASAHPVKVEVRRTAGGADVYLSGLFAGHIEGGVRSLTFNLSPAASIKDVVSVTAEADSGKYLPLDVAALRMPRSFAASKPSVPAGMTAVEDVPMRVTAGEGSADLGLTREGQGNWALEVDEYLARSPFDGLLTEVHVTVPAAPYHRAWVLAAVDPDPAKDPVMTARLTQYRENGIGNNRLADTTITLPRGDEQPGEGVTRVGSVTVNRDGKTMEVPLYLVEVPLKTGQVIDLVMNEPVLNFELFGKPWINMEQLDNTSKPDPESTSAVQVFGVTLEKAPVGLTMVQSQPGNVFHNHETPQTSVVVHAFGPAKGKLTWEIRDVDGEAVGQGETDFALSAAGQERSITIPLNQPQVGWYELLISVRDAAGRTLYTHPARFALLGQDRRQAKYDSPYGVWWFDGAHYTPSELDFAGPIMFKAGIRKVAWTKHSEADMARWWLTKSQVNMPFRFADLDNPEKAKENAKKTMDAHLAKYPHLEEVLVYHESGPGNDIPLELIGLDPQLSPARIEREKRYADLYNLAGEFFEQNYPQIKLVVGNNSAAQSVIAAVFRHGGDPKYIDYIGIEAPSQVFIPEKLQEWALQGNHIARDTARVLTGKDVPATGCYEFTYRSERDMGEHQQAQWYARDMLISQANHFTRIGTGILFDASNSYYNGLWGGSGLLQREPWGYPKKSYVAYATLTNVLDQVELRRQVPTGSSTVYALAFDRSDGKQVAALWASRGEAEFIITFEGDTSAKVIDMYGRTTDTKTTGGKLTVTAGASPAYVVTDKPVASITLGKRTFAKDMARAAQATVAAPFDDVSRITIDDTPIIDTAKAFPLQLPIRQVGKFEVRPATDDEKGAAIEVELAREGELSKYITEYTTLRLNEPMPVEGEPEALGVWVKGDSNWGRVMFEIIDAQGEVWRSVGTSGWGCDILDWPGNLSVNFDGWNFVSLALTETALFNDHSPGPVLEQWVSSGGDKVIDYPISVSAVIVGMNRTPLELTGFTSAKNVIRLKDISGISAAK